MRQESAVKAIHRIASLERRAGGEREAAEMTSVKRDPANGRIAVEPVDGRCQRK